MSSLNTCQYCFAPGCLKDIFHDYYCDGKKEVYCEMLLNTLNVTVSQDIPNNKICEHCIFELRRATEFKAKVLNSINYLATVNCLKVENEDYDDFDDKISVDFDENSHTLADDRDTDQSFVIKLNPRNNFHNQDQEKSPLIKDAGYADDLDADEVTTEIDGVTTSLSKKRKDIDNQRHLARKTKQSESENDKHLKQNSLKLIFNSNLCLFKSLKTKFGCFICREAFLTMKELRHHSKTHDNSELIKAKFNRLRGLSYRNADISCLECSKCKQACLDLTELKKHLTEQHDVKFQEAEHFLIPYKLEDSFHCVICSEKFNTYMRLSVHMNNHYSNNVCEICGSSYINRISLRIHLQSRHKEKKCTLCSETFMTNYARVRHMRTHHNSCMTKRYCLICGKTFRYSYQLMEHKIQEHGVKRQLSKCSLCPKTFTNTQNLKIHVRSVHVKERNFPCDVCEMRFFTKFDQKRHEKTHVDERSFSCEVCESKFKGKDSLRRHLKRQHGQCNYECLNKTSC